MNEDSDLSKSKIKYFLFIFSSLFIVFLIVNNLIDIIFFNFFSIIIRDTHKIKFLSVIFLFSIFINTLFLCFIYYKKNLFFLVLLSLFSIFYVSFLPGELFFNKEIPSIFFIGLLAKFIFNYVLYYYASKFLSLKKSKIISYIILTPVIVVFSAVLFHIVEISFLMRYEKILLFILVITGAITPSLYLFIKSLNILHKCTKLLHEKIHILFVAFVIFIISILRIIDYISYANDLVYNVIYCYIFPPVICFIFLFEFMWNLNEENKKAKRMYWLNSYLSSECLDFLHDAIKLNRSISKIEPKSNQAGFLNIVNKNMLLMEQMSQNLELSLSEKSLPEKYLSIKNLLDDVVFEVYLQTGFTVEVIFKNPKQSEEYICANELIMSRIISNILGNIATHANEHVAIVNIDYIYEKWFICFSISNPTNLKELSVQPRSRGLRIIKRLSEAQGGYNSLEFNNNHMIHKIFIPVKKMVKI